MPVSEYVWNGTDWGMSSETGSDTTFASLQAARAALVLGSYIPGPEFTANSTGIYDEAYLTTTWNPGASGGTFTPTSNTTYQNTLFLGNVLSTVGTSGTITFKNCMFVGNKPELVQAMQSVNPNAAYDFGSGVVNYRTAQFVFEDCTFDNSWWYRNGLSAWWDTTSAYPEVVGFHGTNATLRRCLITGFVDAVNYALGNLDTSQGSMLIEGSRLGGNYYGSEVARADGYVHADGWQVGTGGNVEVRYSYVGGPRLAAELTSAGGITSGCANSAFIIKQESSSNASYAVQNINIHDNWLAGGAATVNLAYNLSNTLSTIQVVNNRIMKRNTSYNGNGYYVLEYTGVTPTVSGNVIWEPTGSLYGNGTAAPVATM